MPEQVQHTLYQVSTATALVEGIYQGAVQVAILAVTRAFLREALDRSRGLASNRECCRRKAGVPAPFRQINKRELAGATGLEPVASCVTGRRSNQLNYASAN
jgi:hypothetical protein